MAAHSCLVFYRAVLLVALSLMGAMAGQAATITVTTGVNAGAGSLRQALASASPGDTINFDSSVSVITVTSGLTVNKDNITIDATNRQTATVVGHVGPVGAGADGIAGSGDEPSMAGTPLPGVFLSSSGGGYVIGVSANNVTLKGLGVKTTYPNTNTPDGVRILGASTGTVLDQLVIGTGSTADMSDQGTHNGRLYRCVYNASTGKLTLSRSTLGFCYLFGYIDTKNANDGTFSENTFLTAGMKSDSNLEPLNLTGSNYRISANYFNNVALAGGGGVAGGLDLPGAQTALVENNSFIDNFTTCLANDEAAAIVVRGDGGRKTTGITIQQNLITGHGSNCAGGVAIQGNGYGDGAEGITISKNAIYANGGKTGTPPGANLDKNLGINIYSGQNINNARDRGVTPNTGAWDANAGNQGMNYPVLTKVAFLSANQVAVAGYVGLHPAGSAVFGGAQVELFYANNTPADQNGEIELGDGQSVPHGEGAIYLGALTADAQGGFNGTLTLSAAALTAWRAMAGHAPQAGDAVTGTATLNGNTSEFGPNLNMLAEPPAASAPAPVPMLSPWLLMAMGLLMAVLAWTRMRDDPAK
jgi:hypothetical protein